MLNKFVPLWYFFIWPYFIFIEMDNNIDWLSWGFIYTGLFFFFTIIVGFLFNNYLGLYGVWILNMVSISLFWCTAIIITICVFTQNLVLHINLGKWFILPTSTIVYCEFVCDALSMSYVTLTITIAVSVLAYIFVYFRYEPLVDRLILLICSFVISMVILVMSNNLIILFLGWELIGLTSFFLINFWNTRVATLKAAFKAFVFNKFSDISLLIAILYLYNETGALNLCTILMQINLLTYNALNFWTFEIPVIEIIVFFF